MQVFILAGERGCGKSTMAEGRAKLWLQKNSPEKFFAYDIERKFFPDRPLPPIKEFMTKVITEQNAFFLFEEGTIFFPNRGRDEHLVQAMVTSRYNNNIMFIIYHALGEIPKYVYRLADCIILFPTKDHADEINRDYKTKRFFNEWNQVNNKPDTCNQFKLKNGKFSPYLIIKL